MGRVYLFGDEAGNFDFSRHQSATRYFLLSTVSMVDCQIANELLGLRRQLAWEGLELQDGFHATDDRQAVRNRVFDVLAQHDFRIDATILDKRKAEPRFHSDQSGFYELAWFYHLRYVAPILLQPGDELHVIAASIGTHADRKAFHKAVDGVAKARLGGAAYKTACWPASVEPCIQVADYCSWAIQRKWERGDARSYDLIRGKIRSEFDAFELGTKLYY